MECRKVSRIDAAMLVDAKVSRRSLLGTVFLRLVNRKDCGTACMKQTSACNHNLPSMG